MYRLQEEWLADDVLTMVTQILNNYPFDFRGARILSGEEEGAYGWITVNYLLGKFTKVIDCLTAPMEWLPRSPCDCYLRQYLVLARVNDG